MAKPEKMSTELYALLERTFEGDEIDEVATALVTARVTTIERVRVMGVTGLESKAKLDPVLATLLAAAVPASTGAPAAPSPAPVAAPPSDAQGAIEALARALGHDPNALDRLSDAALLDRLVASGGTDRILVEFADRRHPAASERGVVTREGRLDKERTLAYWAQSRTYLGARWQGYPVERVTAVCGPKEAHNPFALGEMLQDGETPEGLQLTPFLGMPAVLNFFAWMGDQRPRFVGDGGYALVDVIAEKGVEGLTAHPRFGRPYREYQDAVARDPSLATRYLARIFRAPDAAGTGEVTGAGDAPPPTSWVARNTSWRALDAAGNACLLNHESFDQFVTSLDLRPGNFTGGLNHRIFTLMTQTVPARGLDDRAARALLASYGTNEAVRKALDAVPAET